MPLLLSGGYASEKDQGATEAAARNSGFFDYMLSFL